MNTDSITTVCGILSIFLGAPVAYLAPTYPKLAVALSALSLAFGAVWARFTNRKEDAK